MRIWSSGLLILAIVLSACGPTVAPRTELPADQYPQWASYFAAMEYCHATGRLSPEDVVALRRVTNENLSRHTFDAAAINQISQQMMARWRQLDADPDRRGEIVEGCARQTRTAASNRAIVAQNRAAQLHQAQMAAAQAASWQPQPFVQPQIPVYQAPLVQTPQLGRSSNYYYCNRLSSHVVSCR